MDGTAVNILLIDDDEIDVRIVLRALKEENVSNPVTVARDGIEALELLRDDREGTRLEKPVLILLDLNMPRMNGFKFLEVIREDPQLKGNIIFVLTSSRDDRDMLKAYEHNIAGYLLKSQVGTDFMQTIKMIKHFTFCVQFPPAGDP